MIFAKKSRFCRCQLYCLLTHVISSMLPCIKCVSQSCEYHHNYFLSHKERLQLGLDSSYRLDVAPSLKGALMYFLYTFNWIFLDLHKKPPFIKTPWEILWWWHQMLETLKKIIWWLHSPSTSASSLQLLEEYSYSLVWYYDQLMEQLFNVRFFCVSPSLVWVCGWALFGGL